jgi:hypothetical protein
MVYPLILPKVSALFLTIRKQAIASCAKLHKVPWRRAEIYGTFIATTF